MGPEKLLKLASNSSRAVKLPQPAAHAAWKMLQKMS
jgi:hypothetical protein